MVTLLSATKIAGFNDRLNIHEWCYMWKTTKFLCT